MDHNCGATSQFGMDGLAEFDQVLVQFQVTLTINFLMCIVCIQTDILIRPQGQKWVFTATDPCPGCSQYAN